MITVKKVASFTLLILCCCQLSYARWYTNYDSSGRVVSISSEKVSTDTSLLEDLYVFVSKDPNSVFTTSTYSKEHVMKVGDTYIFNESLNKGLKESNDDFRFDRIITVEEQIKDDRRVVKSVLDERDISHRIKKADVDESKPRIIYKPYAAIMQYSILNKSNQIIESWSEKSSMQFLTIKDCNKEIPKYRNIAQNNLNNYFFVKSQLLKGQTSVSCSKITK